METLLPALRITLPEAGRLDPAALFPAPPAELWLEIGFGGGEHLAAVAAARPEIGLIGAEPFLNGVARLLGLVEAGGLADRVRLLVDDARLLLEALPDASLDRVMILFPDPWPKARQHKRRLVAPATVAALARVMRPDAELRLATDDAGYAREMLWTVRADGRFAWLARRPADWRQRPEDWPPTRYELKALLAGRQPAFLRFRRLPR